MMRSLHSGVSGMKAHQVAMDIEGNNIANVNTNGFKYSRADFSTMFSQTIKIATGPAGNIGGKNAMQIGLGTSINSSTRIHSQGSISATDKPTDVAIEGDGFFMVSDDGGLSRFLTRDGDFKLDAAGNFVNNSGYVVQGWNRDMDAGTLDTSKVAGNIFIDPGLNIPANASTEVGVKANLNSGPNIGDKKTTLYSLDSVYGFNLKRATAANENDTGTTQFYTTSKNEVAVTEKAVDVASLYNADGQAFNLRDGQGIWISYADARFDTNKAGVAAFDPNLQQTQTAAFWGSANGNITPNGTVTLDITINGIRINNTTITSIDDAITTINSFSSPTDTRDGTGVRAVKNADGSGISLVNSNSSGTTDNMKNINLVVNAGNTAGEYHTLTYTAATNTFAQTALTRTPVNGVTPSLWLADGVNVTAQPQAGGTVTFTAGAALGTAAGANLTLNSANIITAHKYTYNSSPQTLASMINPDGGPVYVPGTAAAAGDPLTWPATPEGAASQNYYEAVVNGSLKNNSARIFHSTEDLRELLQRDARYGVDYDGSGIHDTGDLNEKVKIVVSENGNYVISNVNETTTTPSLTTVGGVASAALTATAKNMNFAVSSFTDAAGTVSKNDAFSGIFEGFIGNLSAGNSNKQTQSLHLSALTATLRIFDTLGSTHNLEVQFVKQSTTLDGGNEWSMIIRVPEPGQINTSGDGGPENIIVGSARFGNNGSLISYNPRTLNFSPNNGAASNQQINLLFGDSGSYGGIVSNHNSSAVTSQGTDGYPAGSINTESLKADEQGLLWASFTNGMTLPLAQIALATVANNAGLDEMGSNLFRQTANSGDIVVGTSGTGGKGNIRAGALESSNVDLSNSLTQLIIVQRGYQANSKTISTSDEMLQTLLQLK